ncbi:unnamed protein product [Echinostoma caproni]|uniref:Transposase n=1 Tax=Echinostoma caproni TaxID=27848 RepID=A0A183BC02_9TREM|nr:unnamed protein product [Echinostoma caproni]
MYRTQKSKNVKSSEKKELNSKFYTKLPHEGVWVTGTLLNQSGLQTVIELGDFVATLRRDTDHVRSRPADTITVEYSNESSENHEETNSDTT